MNLTVISQVAMDSCELVRITILRLSSEPGTVRKSVSQQRSQPFYNQIGGSIVVFGSMSRLL